MNVKNVHPVSGTGIRTHNFLITSLLPQSLDHGSRVSLMFKPLNSNTCWSLVGSVFGTGIYFLTVIV